MKFLYWYMDHSRLQKVQSKLTTSYLMPHNTQSVVIIWVLFQLFHWQVQDVTALQEGFHTTHLTPKYLVVKPKPLNRATESAESCSIFHIKPLEGASSNLQPQVPYSTCFLRLPFPAHSFPSTCSSKQEWNDCQWITATSLQLQQNCITSSAEPAWSWRTCDKRFSKQSTLIPSTLDEPSPGVRSRKLLRNCTCHFL